LSRPTAVRDALVQALDAEAAVLRSGTPAVIACSGGLDSTVLARLVAPLLLQRDRPTTLACLDHGWREDASHDVAFVRDLAEQLGVAFVTALRVPDPLLVGRVGREAAARQARRCWLRDVASELGALSIYLGHHRDDDVETVLLRRQEGVPAERAATMRRRDGPFVRPLLDLPRASLEAAARAAGWTWRDDPTNDDLSLARNRVRKGVLPALRDADPGAGERLLAAGRAARDRLDGLATRVDRLLPDLLDSQDAPDRRSIDRAALAGLDHETALHVLQRLCRPLVDGDRPPGRAALETLLADCLPGGPSRLRHLGAGWTARTSGARLELRRDGPLELEGAEPPARSLDVGQPVDWRDEWQLAVRALPADEARARLRDGSDQAGRSFALFDADHLPRPLSVLPAGQGMRIRPFGLGGSRSVRELLAEAGVARDRRAGWPVVVDGDGRPIWIPGLRAADAAPLAPESGAAIMLYTSAASRPVRPAADPPETP
jgi:tRNA(Ile)-lysidine synthase